MKINEDEHETGIHLVIDSRPSHPVSTQPRPLRVSTFGFFAFALTCVSQCHVKDKYVSETRRVASEMILRVTVAAGPHMWTHRGVGGVGGGLMISSHRQ